MAETLIESWAETWKKILRQRIFKDEQLKTLMLIPSNVKINKFVEQYFIQTGSTSELLTDQKVRVIYGFQQKNTTGVPNVVQHLLNFDIYVKYDDMHTATNDTLDNRTTLIANRLNLLLTKIDVDQWGHIDGYKFTVAGEKDSATRTVGYSRYTISFWFNKVY